MVEVFRRDTRALIAYVNSQIFSGCRGGARRSAFFNGQDHFQSSPLIHGLDGVHDKIGQHLLYLQGINGNGRYLSLLNNVKINFCFTRD